MSEQKQSNMPPWVRRNTGCWSPKCPHLTRRRFEGVQRRESRHSEGGGQPDYLQPSPCTASRGPGEHGHHRAGLTSEKRGWCLKLLSGLLSSRRRASTATGATQHRRKNKPCFDQPNQCHITRAETDTWRTVASRCLCHRKPITSADLPAAPHPQGRPSDPWGFQQARCWTELSLKVTVYKHVTKIN